MSPRSARIIGLSAPLRKTEDALILLHHKVRLLCLEALLPQQGHRGRVLMSALIKRTRMVAIEFAMWRSGRKGGSPGSITVGYRRRLQQRGATRS